MCGIVGFIDNKKYRQLLPNMWAKIDHRGEDSYGVIVQGDKVHTAKSLTIHKTKKTTTSYYDTKKRQYIKKTTPESKGVMAQIQKIPVGDFLLAHNRAASIGGVTEELAHPITKVGNDGTVSVIHNGTKKDLTKVFDILGDSDTEIIAQLLADHFAPSKTISAALEGAGVVFGVRHEDGAVLFHCDGERPLFIDETRSIIASEPIFKGKWFLVKEQTKMFHSLRGFIDNVEVYEKSVDVKEKDLSYPAYCKACKKTHFTDATDGRCYRCIIKGIEAPKSTTYSYSYSTYYGASDTIPKEALVEYYSSFYHNFGIGIVEEKTKDGYKIRDLMTGELIDIDEGIYDYVEHDVSEALKLNETYRFTDNGQVIYHKKYLGKNSSNSVYPYFCEGTYNSKTPYKYVLYEKGIEKKLNLELYYGVHAQCEC